MVTITQAMVIWQTSALLNLVRMTANSVNIVLHAVAAQVRVNVQLAILHIASA